MMKRFTFSEAQRQWSAPGFQLPAMWGQMVSLGNYRGRCNVVLVFSHNGDCRPCHEGLKRFAALRAEYQAEDAEVWAVLPEPVEAIAAVGRALPLRFPRLLADPDGATRRTYARLLPEPPAESDTLIFVLDRFGAPHVAFAGDRPDDPAVHKEILSWLAGIELECPE